jgi:hypothetical protein
MPEFNLNFSEIFILHLNFVFIPPQYLQLVRDMFEFRLDVGYVRKRSSDLIEIVYKFI